MNDPRFESLGDEQFQRFCQSLLTYEFPNLQALEVNQPDGGRDALNRGSPESFFVFQVKYVKTSTPLKEPEKWAAGVLRKELPKIRRLAERGAERYRLITNAGGSAHLDAGAVDRVNAYLAETLPIPADCWWRADLNTRVVKHPELRWGYPELLTPTDVLKELVGNPQSEEADRRLMAIKAFLVAQYGIDKYVRFKQVDLQNDLLNLFIDVPAGFENIRSRRFRLANSLIQRLSPRRLHVAAVSEGVGAADLLLHPDAGMAIPTVVVEGAPGQGKSTLGQYLCQVHRMKLLRRITELRRLPESHSDGPARLPFKIDLRHFAAFLQGDDPYAGETEWGGLPPAYPRSLESFLACTVMRFSGGAAFTLDDLRAVLKESYALVVLDGLDEVAEFRDRRAVVDAIKIGVERLGELAIGLQTVITSRPAAFTRSPGFSAAEVPHLQLQSITPQLVTKYADQWIAARRLSASDGQDVRRVLDEQLDQPHIRDLARNPMQLAILLTLMLTKGDSLPDKRTDLYESYLSIFFDREAAKSSVVREHRDVLIRLHEYLAWRLHAQAEISSAGGTISQADLESEVRHYLDREGENPDLADQLFKGIVERVIALVSRVQGRFEFEIQPLREYFAAAYLYSTAQVSTGSDEKPGTIIDRFDGLARSPFWLNVVRFYAGFYNSGQLPSLVMRLEAMSKDPDWTLTDRPRVLASLFLGDWSFALERQSREAAIDLVLKDLGARHALSVSPLQPYIESRSALPVGAGRKETLDKAWELLKSRDLPGDRRQLLELLISVTGEPGRRDWIEYLRELSGAERTRWIQLGYQTDALTELQPADFDLLWDDGAVSDFSRRAAWAAESGHAEEIEADEQKCSALIEGLISGDVTAYFDEDYPTWVGALGSLLSPYRAYERGLIEKMSHAARRLQREARQESPSAQRAGQVVRDVLRLAEAGSSPIAVLPEVVALSQEAWGEGWGLYGCALAWAAANGRPARPGPRLDLADRQSPLISRILYGRSKGGKTSGKWWVGQLEAADSRAEKMLAVVCALSWASGDALLESVQLAAKHLDGLSEDDFQSVLGGMGRLEWGRGAGKSLPLDKGALMSMPPRVALALSRRDVKFGRRFAESRLRRYRGADIEVLRACLEATSDVVIRGRHASRSDLRLMRRAYAVTGGPHAEAGFRLHAPSIELMPVNIAEEIVADAEEYPLAVVQAAERRCFRHANRKRPPLQEIAERDAWFVHQAPRL